MSAAPVRLARLDHIVLTVHDVAVSARFYERVLGMRIVTEAGRTALHFAQHKINLHPKGREFEPKATHPTVGGGDFCLIAETPLDRVAAHLADCGVAIELGPVERAGALGTMRSLYFRDPDGNLVEVANYA